MTNIMDEYLERLYRESLQKRGESHIEEKIKDIKNLYLYASDKMKETEIYAKYLMKIVKQKDAKYLEVGSGLYDNVTKHFTEKGYKDMTLLTPYEMDEAFIAPNKKISGNLLPTGKENFILYFNSPYNFIPNNYYENNKKAFRKVADYSTMEDFDVVILSSKTDNRSIDEKERILKSFANGEANQKIIDGFCTSIEDKSLDEKIEFYKKLREQLSDLNPKAEVVNKSDIIASSKKYVNTLIYSPNAR